MSSKHTAEESTGERRPVARALPVQPGQRQAGANDLLALQRSAGNAAVSRLVAGSEVHGASGSSGSERTTMGAPDNITVQRFPGKKRVRGLFGGKKKKSAVSAPAVDPEQEMEAYYASADWGAALEKWVAETNEFARHRPLDSEDLTDPLPWDPESRRSESARWLSSAYPLAQYEQGVARARKWKAKEEQAESLREFERAERLQEEGAQRAEAARIARQLDEEDPWATRRVINQVMTRRK